MKFSNTLLLAAATAALAMAVVPVDATFSFDVEGYDGKDDIGQPLASTSPETVRPIRKQNIRRFATEDAPSVLGAPATSDSSLVSSSSPKARRQHHARHRHGRRYRGRPHRQHHGRRASSAARRRRHRHRRLGQGRGTHGHNHHHHHHHHHTATPAQVPTSGTAMAGSAAASQGGKPSTMSLKEQMEVLRAAPYMAALARYEKRVANQRAAEQESWRRHSMYANLHSVADSGYSYELSDDAYDEGFSVSVGAFGDDDGWDDAYEGVEFSFSDEADGDDGDDAWVDE